MFRTLRFYHSFFKFLSTPSSRRATQDQIHHLWRGGHFYPRPPRGGRPGFPSLFRKVSNFYPRPPRGGRPSTWLSTILAQQYFYPRPPRGGRPAEAALPAPIVVISIHALREEGDETSGTKTSTPAGFLSTPSARRATAHRGRRQIPESISIHALREEGDPAHAEDKADSLYFYPRPPRGGRHTVVRPHGLHLQFLSTPSARRATPKIVSPLSQNANFYPRPPRGGRQSNAKSYADAQLFLSTPSARRATSSPALTSLICDISIHALREEGDCIIKAKRANSMYFYPRPPRGGRRSRCSPAVTDRHFYPRPPRGGRPVQRTGLIQTVNFYPRPPRGGRLW